MICLNRLSNQPQEAYDYLAEVAERRPPLKSGLKVAYWENEGGDCISIYLYDILEVLEASTLLVRQKDTYAVLLERNRVFAVNISAYPPANYYLFDTDVFLAKDDLAKLDYISMLFDFFPLPRTMILKLYRLNQNEEFYTFLVEEGQLKTDD